MRGALVGMLVFLGIALWFANMSYRTLAEPDEGRYAEIPREMLASGDWITPHLNAIPYLEKPPLQYWATAVAYSVLGVAPWVSRLWATTLGLLGIVVTFMTGRALWGTRAGVFAALILASCPLYFVIAHIDTLDIALAFFMNAALMCSLMAWRADPASRTERRWMWLCWLAMASGFLQKGLVAIVLPAVALFAYALLYRDFRLWRRLRLREGLPIFAVLTLPWLILVSLRNPDFLQFFFIHEHLARFATTVHHRSEPWWFFIAILAVGVLPWITIVLRAARDCWRDGRSTDRPGRSTLHTEGLLLIWALVQLAFFSASGSKLAPYIVPAVPPLALLAGRWLQSRGTIRTLWPTVIICGALCLLLLCLDPLVAHFVAAGPKQTAYLKIANWARLAGAIGLAGVVTAVLAMRTHRMNVAVLALASGFSFALTLLMCGGNSLDALRTRPGLAALIAPHLTADTPFYCVGMYWHTLPFALQRTCTVVQHTGELETQFDPQRRHWMPTVEDFAAQWRREPSAVAVVSPAVWSQLQATGLVPRTILQGPNVVVMVKP